MLEQRREIPMTREKSPSSFTKEEKERLIARMLPPESISPTELSKETGINKSTLATWKGKALRSGIDKGVTRTKGALSSREKFLIVMETYTMSEIELSKYCREKGLYVEEVKSWRLSCIDANQADNANSKEIKQQLHEEKKRAKELEKELTRKEKALAETAALLVLRKKLDAILGENEED
jgi:transposase